MPAWTPGSILTDRFTLIRPLGAGGMGEVWRVHDRELQIDVVAKRVPARASAEQIELLRRECVSARRLSHPNIVRVFDFHQAEPSPFITMELIEGRDLCDLRGDRPERVISALLPVVDALDHAHRLGVIHRDLKCSNVLVDAGGQPHVADFGIAGLLESGAGEIALAGGGTRHKASPQQLDGEPPRIADDVYGLGCLLFELIAGDPPFPPDADLDTLREAPPPALRSRHVVPESLAELAERMLAKSPQQRPAGMPEVAEGLRRAQGELAAEGTSPPARARSEVRLTPPPRIPPPAAAGKVAAGGGRRGTGRTRPGPWTLGAFAAAIASLVVVFAVLPGWVGRISDSSDPPPAASRQTRSDAASAPPAGDGSPGVGSPVSPQALDEVEPEVEEAPPPRAGSRSAGRMVRAEPRPEAAPPRAASESGSAAAPRPRAFAQAMTEGLAASARADHEGAREAFERALLLSPGAVEAQDGLAAAEMELRLAEIGERRRRAAAHESEERWRAAIDEYEAVQAIDPTVLFAQEGLARSRNRAELDDKLASFLAAHERLAADEVLAEAASTLEVAESVQPRGPRLEGQIRGLARAVAAAATPVEVVLVSDAVTQVWIYRVGRLGSFERRTLELRPGRYTVVGSREGFRDVRLELEVAAGKSPAPLVVRCEEKI